jgi:hypothetical protein
MSLKVRAVEQFVSKSGFAKLRNGSPPRVSQWIAAGQIGPEAIVGAGRGALIRADIAVAHLRERLDSFTALSIFWK